MMVERILAVARSEIGTPFRHQGRIPGVALDCAGLVVRVAYKIEAKYLDYSGYSRHPSDGLLESALDAQPCLARVQVSEMQAGDVLLMRFKSDPQHLALFAGWSDVYQAEGVIHAWLQARKVCEHVLTDEWRARIVRVYRFLEAA